jgi:rhodanese-related sulfurtransferase
MNKQLWAGLSIFLLCISGASGQKGVVLSASEFQEQINQPGIQLLDVRTSKEYTAGHIKNSLQADWLNEKQFKERVKHLDKAKPLYIYCGSGVRSNDAGRWLRNNGFQQVLELQNGIVSWKKNQNSLESETAIQQMSVAEYELSLDSASLVLVDFGAKWCPPCKKMEPVLEQLKNDLNGKFVLWKIDGDSQTTIMRHLGVEELPTFIIYKNSKEIWRKTGLITLGEFKSNLQQDL